MNPTSTPLPQQTRGTGILATVQRFGPAFWAANVMELIERWAYYGVRAVLSLYIVDAAARGGLEFTHVQKGGIYSAWAIVQLVPFTGIWSVPPLNTTRPELSKPGREFDDEATSVPAVIVVVPV